MGSEQYQAIDRAMQILRPCSHAYTGEQAHAVARELQRLHDETDRLRTELTSALLELDRIRENNDAIISGSLASHLAAAEVKDALRDAFDAGARAMRASVWENYNKDGDFGFAMFATEDITKLPGRPE